MKLQRLIAMLTLLLRTECLPASDLAERFGVSVRTVYRDVEALEGAGIPMVTVPGVHGGIGILEAYKIDKKLFTNEDMITLLTGLHTVSGSMNAAALNRTAVKIRSLLPPEQARAIELDARKLHIDLSPWAHNPRIGENLEKIQQALHENRLLTFHYTTLRKERALRRVEPHQLLLKENLWYLRAYCLDRANFRVFKLGRMEGLEMLEESFAPRDFTESMRDFKEWTHERMIEIELLVQPPIKELLLDRCLEENMTETADGRIHLRMAFVESDLGYGYLMQYGEGCECVAPAHVRQELIRRIDAMRRQYQGG